MVRAILDGRKTQTRRIVKPHANAESARENYAVPNVWVFQDKLRGRCFDLQCPHGKPGDRLWVRETFSPDATSMYPCPPAWYRASDDIDRSDFHTCPKEHRGNYADCLKCWEEREHSKFKWRPSIHMPRSLSRINLEITAIRVERLQSIKEKDAIAEGVTKVRDGCYAIKGFDYDLSGLCHTDAVTPYAKLWDSINGPDVWDANPWVWVIEFRKL